MAPATDDPCAGLRNLIAASRAALAQDAARVRHLQNQLDDLSSQPDPDPAKVAELRAELGDAREKVEEDQQTLADQQDDFEANCSGDTPP
ncbi:hypothetical protein [Kitasatospora sp. NPDC054795]